MEILRWEERERQISDFKDRWHRNLICWTLLHCTLSMVVRSIIFALSIVSSNNTSFFFHLPHSFTVLFLSSSLFVSPLSTGLVRAGASDWQCGQHISLSAERILNKIIVPNLIWRVFFNYHFLMKFVYRFYAFIFSPALPSLLKISPNCLHFLLD